MDKKFTVHGGSFVGIASATPIGHNGMILATAVGTVTPTFFPLQFGAEAVGTGNGVLTTFNLDNFPIEADSQEIYVDGILKAETTDYTIVDATGAITFLVAPANTLVITANYKGTISKAVPVVAGQVLEVGGNCSTVTSTAAVVLS